MTQEMMSREEIEDCRPSDVFTSSLHSELDSLCNTALAYHDQKQINKELYEALDDLVNFTEAMMEGHGCSLIDVARDVLAKDRGDQS